MASKKRTERSRKRTKTAVSVYPASAVTIAAQNLLNMAVVTGCCATILLGLMIVKHF